ncbi:2-amino-4-hydroxy-6-hydroxymethyldihydropteridine diphosphokinase [Sulfitobacter sp. HNIBRBA2951]|uniref:2-amino-4-hydroxy-6- hydroxymethyldihydropteridine diphosphokinase n=1 Tax=Sulfitobacter aquimarinus TaxID=3158557 RepID=UPI0032DFC776
MGKSSVKSPTIKKVCYISYGSNLGLEQLTSIQLVVEALNALDARGLVIRARSRAYATPAFPAGAGPDFVNGVICAETPFDPEETLAVLHTVEARFGRERAVRWGARTLDLDLIAIGQEVAPDAQTQQYWRELPPQEHTKATPAQLIVPHPRLAERAFVLVPLMDIAPDWRHPLTGLTVRDMHDALPDAARAEVVAL